LLVAEPDDSNPITAHRTYRLYNRGQGIAFQVCYWEGSLEERNLSRVEHDVEPSTLAPGTFAEVAIPTHLISWVARYKGIDDQERWLKVFLEPRRGQEHIIRIGGKEKHLQ
jgi:hypothetical protein